MSAIKVMGHCPPDTDSTCSPIVYAWFLSEYRNMDAKAYICGKINREAEFVLDYFGVETPEQTEKVEEGDQLVLVDTNNPEELITGYETAEIIEIVDHHKLHGLKTSNIPVFTNRPYGCVATVLWELMADAQTDLPRDMAGLMLACILSDTLKFTSPTTTEQDKEAGLKLAELAGIDIDALANDMFAAKSRVDGMSARDVLLTDAKDFDFGGKVYKIAVLETTDPSQALGMRTELETEMNKLKQEESVTGIFFFVVDIVQSNATLLVSNNTEVEIAKQAFNADFGEDGLMVLPGVVSRKKQIAPAIEQAV